MVLPFSVSHLVEVAVLLLVAYLVGCAVGYGARSAIAALRAPRPVKVQVAKAEAVPVEIPPRPSPAVRLAMAASADEAVPDPVVIQPVPVPVAAKKVATPRDPKPKSLPGPRDGIKDDLRQIKGIGPKIELVLNEAGVFHFDQIAKWTKSNVDWVDLKLGFKGRVAREQWVPQAKALSAVSRKKTPTPA